LVNGSLQGFHFDSDDGDTEDYPSDLDSYTDKGCFATEGETKENEDAEY
jgi:hypothetical protein